MSEERENTLLLHNLHLQYKLLYVTYADFESLLVPISPNVQAPEASYIEKIWFRTHITFS